MLGAHFVLPVPFHINEYVFYSVLSGKNRFLFFCFFVFFCHHECVQILLHSGVLSDKANHHYAEGAFKGGPLGELVQWADLITSVYMLGHRITLSTEISQLTAYINQPKGSSCPLGEFDVIYVDIVGLRQFKDIAKDKFSEYL